MKQLFVILLLLSFAAQAFADDDGTRAGCWNTGSTDYADPIEDNIVGGIFEYSGAAGKDVDSAVAFVQNTNTAKDMSMALYRLWPGTQWTFVDSTATRNISASTDTILQAFVFVEGYVLVADSDSLYAVCIWSDGGGGDAYVMRIDSTGAEGTRIVAGTFGDGWPATIGGNTANPNTQGISYVRYDPEAVGAAGLPYSYVHGPGDTAYVHGPAGAQAVHRK